MFARFDENPALTLRVIKETKRYGRTDGRTDNVKTVYPLQTKFAGGIIMAFGPHMLDWHNLCTGLLHMLHTKYNAVGFMVPKKIFKGFFHYKAMGALCYHANQKSIPNIPKPYAAFSPI